MKPHFLVIAALMAVVSCGPSEEEVKANEAKILQLLEVMRGHLTTGRVDSAQATVHRARALFEEGADATASLRDLSVQLDKAGSSTYLDETLAKLSEKGLIALKRGDKIKYFDDSTVNAYFLKQLKSHSSDWARLHKNAQQAKLAAAQQDVMTAQIAAKESANLRRAYATVLRNNFLDGGLDIDVKVSGKNATYLKLEYALFGAVWGRKFETEGLFSKFREMGFAKVELSDKYDYDYIWTL